jgi:cation diffusion facilitator family transporter
MMRPLDAAHWEHDHEFDRGNAAGERGTLIVAWLTAGMMVVEIVAGWWYNSMALLADGFHMSSHALAIGLSAFAYAAARRYATDRRFAFGTWKIEVLAGFASAVLLLVITALMAFGSVERLVVPQSIRFQEATGVAVVGLVVNVISALILGRAHHGEHRVHAEPHGHGNRHPHRHHDLNLRSAYLHVIADVATSVLAIVALLGGLLYGWSWLDPAMGLVGAALIALWAKNLLAQTGNVLLDREMDHPVVDAIRGTVGAKAEGGLTRIADLHVWRVGRGNYSCALVVVTDDASLRPADVRAWLAGHPEIAHLTVEVNAEVNGGTPGGDRVASHGRSDG